MLHYRQHRQFWKRYQSDIRILGQYLPNKCSTFCNHQDEHASRSFQKLHSLLLQPDTWILQQPLYFYDYDDYYWKLIKIHDVINYQRLIELSNSITRLTFENAKSVAPPPLLLRVTIKAHFQIQNIIFVTWSNIIDTVKIWYTYKVYPWTLQYNKDCPAKVQQRVRFFKKINVSNAIVMASCTILQSTYYIFPSILYESIIETTLVHLGSVALQHKLYLYLKTPVEQKPTRKKCIRKKVTN